MSLRNGKAPPDESDGAFGEERELCLLLLGEQIADLNQEVRLRESFFLFGNASALGLELLELVHRNNHHEVDDRCHRDELNDCGEDQPPRDVPVADGEHGRLDLAGGRRGCDQRRDEAIDNGGDNGGESRTDDDSDGEVNDVAAQNEISEPLKHGVPLFCLRYDEVAAEVVPPEDDDDAEALVAAGDALDSAEPLPDAARESVR